MTSKLNNLFDYVQERCLWQFASRTWDRTENIEGVLNRWALCSTDSTLAETPAERLLLADAKVLVNDCRQRYDWVDVDPAEEVDLVLEGLKDRLLDVTITRSKNRELNHSLY